MPNTDLVSFITPILKSNPIFIESIDSIYNQIGLTNFEVIVVNNGDDPVVEDQIHTLLKKYPSLQVISCKKRGPGAARNMGAKIAKGNFFAFIDSDVILKSNWAQALLTKMADFYDCAAAPIIPFQHDNNFLNDFRYNWREHTTQGSFIVSTANLSQALPVINTAACVYKASSFRALKGFDEKYIRTEDIDLAYRAYHYGCRFIYSDCSSAEVYYFGGLPSYCLRYFYDGLYSMSQTPLSSFITACTTFNEIKIEQKYHFFYYFLIFLRFSGAICAKIFKNYTPPQDNFIYKNCKANLFINIIYQDKKYYLNPESRIIAVDLQKNPRVWLGLYGELTSISLSDFKNIKAGDTSSFDEFKIQRFIQNGLFRLGH